VLAPILVNEIPVIRTGPRYVRVYEHNESEALFTRLSLDVLRVGLTDLCRGGLLVEYHGRRHGPGVVDGGLSR
jgi:hypothetical protein